MSKYVLILLYFSYIFFVLLKIWDKYYFLSVSNRTRKKYYGVLQSILRIKQSTDRYYTTGTHDTRLAFPIYHIRSEDSHTTPSAPILGYLI